MAIIGHVGREEGPLGQGFAVDVGFETGEVLDQSQTSVILSNTFKENEWVMLPHVTVVEGFLVGIVEAFETSIRQGFLVFGP